MGTDIPPKNQATLIYDGKRKTITMHIFLAILPWVLLIAILVVPHRYNWFARGVNYIADAYPVDARLAAFCFFALLWGTCRIGNARFLKCKIANGVLFVVSTVAIELLIAFVVCIIVFLSKFDMILQT